MFVTTFYSYKGGVGRTMALANVAAVLSEMGKRVLVVDFDLEAPGIPSYDPFEGARGRPGVVDYVNRYLATNEAPDVEDFVTRCRIDDSRDVWVMPAGDNTCPQYAQAYASIDWAQLYDQRDGYLMMEDMRNQWAQFEGQGFDHVLIDSRTGHTDTSGICTRQLPDLVVILFAPTRQNLVGLQPVVELIRGEPGRGGREIRILFCPSNVPDLFDEDDVLGRAMTSAEETLGYGDPASLDPEPVTINHWANMALLDLPVITLSREKSKLAKQYRDLTDSILAENPADLDGARVALARLPKILEAARDDNRGRIAVELQERAKRIARHHPEDATVAILTADVFFEAQAYEEAERFLSVALENGQQDARHHLLRAVARINLGERDGALDDLKAVLSSDVASSFDFRPAARLLRSTTDRPADVALEIFSRKETKPRAKIQLAPYLMTGREHLGHVADVLVQELERPEHSDDLSGDLVNNISIALIGAGRFEEALSYIQRILDDNPEDLASRFNAMVARWGIEGTARQEDIDFLSAALNKAPMMDANHRQCGALVAAKSGELAKASSELDAARERSRSGVSFFSCWTYLYRAADAFHEDLDSMARAFASDSQDTTPPFLQVPDR